MMINNHCRALQHLLVQGFTLYPAPAAVCTRLVLRPVLDDPGHAWAVYFTRDALVWTGHLLDDDPLAAIFGAAAVRSSASAPHVVCHTQGSMLLVPLEVADVRRIRMRIEAAIALGKTPTADRLEAFPDELIEREAKRRRKRAKRAKSNQPQES